MAGEERDARLILQAEDRASKTFATVAKSIKDVRQELEAEVAAAAKGEGSIDKLSAALSTLKRLGDDLVRSQSTLKAFEAITDRVGKAETRLESAKKALVEYQNQLGAGGPKTDAQVKKLERLDNAVQKAQGSFDTASKRFAEVESRMERAGLAAGQFDAQTDAIAASAREAASGIAVASQAVDAYANNLAHAQAEQRKLSEAQNLKAAVAASPLGSSDLAYVLSFENAMEKLRETEALYAREQKTQTAAELQSRAAKKAALDEVLAGNVQLTAQFEQLAAESARSDNATNFRKIGSDAVAAAQDLSRFGGEANQAGTAVTRLATVVRGLVNPTQAAAASVSGVVGLIDEAAAVADAKGTPALNAYSAAIGKLSTAQNGLIQQAGMIDSFRQQEAAVAALEGQLKQAQAEVVSIGQKMAQADAPVEEWAKDLKVAEGNLETLGNALTREKGKLAQTAAALQHAGIETRDLAKAERDLVAATERAAAAQQKLSSKQGGKGGFLGLNPYEIQNLGYQINDVFTQLASGTSITQTLGQQGGQILQLFRGAIPFILRFLPLIGLVVAAFALIGGAASRANDKVQALKDWSGIFALMGQGADYSAKAFADAQEKLTDLGVSAEDAKKLLKEFIDSGLDPSQMESFITTATNLAKVTGLDLPEAAKLMGDAYSGGMDQIIALDEATHVFTDTQLEQIQALYDAGKADEARAMAMRIVEDQTNKSITQMDGPWTAAMRGAKTGWQNLLTALGNTSYFTNVRNNLANLAADMKDVAIGWVYITALMKGATKEAARAQALGIAVPGGGGKPARPAGGGENDPNRRTSGGQEYLRTQNQQLRTAKAITGEQRLQLAIENARNEAAQKGASNSEVALAGENARRLEQLKLDKEKASRDRSAASAARGAASRARAAQSRREAEARKAESLRDRIRDMQQGVDNQIASMDAQIARAQNRSLEERLKGVDDANAKIFAAIDKAQEEGVPKKVADAQRARVQANIVILKQLETEKYYNEQLKDLTDERKQKLTEVEDAYARGEISAADAVKRAMEISSTMQPAIADMANKALAFAEALNSAHPSADLQAFIAQMRQLVSDNTGAGAAKVMRDFTDARMSEEGQRLNNVIEQRNQLVDAQNKLVELGLQTRKGAQTEIEAGYARTQPLLDAQIASMTALLGTLDLTNPAIKLLYDTWVAKLQAVKAEGTYVSSTFTTLKQGIDGAITQNAMEGFDTIAKSLAGLVTGGQGVIKTFGQIGMAALNFVGQTIGAIGRLILQMLILDAIQKATGIPVAALAGAMNGQGSGGFLGIIGKLFHDGGIAGTGNYGRSLPAAAYIGAPRYHGGGIAGLAPDETTAILKVGEEVLTEDSPRHRNNFQGGGPAAPPRPVKQVLVMDKRQLAEAMQSPEGEEVFITHVRNNRSTLKQILA